MPNPVSAILIVIVTIFIPPLGVFLIAGCGADLLINICLTVLGQAFPHHLRVPWKIGVVLANTYFPGHIHAFYLEYIYFNRRDQARLGNTVQKRAPGVYSENVQNGGQTAYGTAQV